MAQGSESSSIIHPTLHHFGVETRHLERMIDWYARVVGMVTICSTSNALGPEAVASMSAVFASNDRANHRMAILSTPELKEDTHKHAHAKLQHVAFEYATIDDFLNTYTRLKGLLIEPVLTVDHGPTTAFYYEDPDGNSVELFVDNFGAWDKSREYVQTSPEFHQNALGTLVDADKLVAARQAGMSLAELHRRAYAGEFPPSRPMDPRVLM
jgi:catechol 2,3-dioxygenase